MMSIDDVIGQLRTVLKQNTVKAPDIPKPILLLSKEKNGLSAREMAREVIIRQAEAGAPVGLLEDGQESVSEKMERIRMEVIVKHLLQNGKISVAIPPFSINVIGQGESAVGPVSVKATNIKPVYGNGIIQ